VSTREWLWCWFWAAVVAGAAAVIMLAGTAHASPVHRTVNLTNHDVLKSSTMPPCSYTSRRPLPCAVGFGRQGVGYWVGLGKHKHYLWGQRPRVIVSGFAHWATATERHRLGVTGVCWVRRLRGAWRYRCPTDPSDG
jgi:hypothetical protein